MLLLVVAASRKVCWSSLCTCAYGRSSWTAPFVAVSKPWLLNLRVCALVRIRSITEILLDVRRAMVYPVVLVHVWRWCLFEAFLLENLGAGKLQMILLLLLVYYFWEIIVLVQMDPALCILMLHLGHVHSGQPLVRALFEVGKLDQCLTKLIMVHWVVWVQIGWLSVIWWTGPAYRSLLIYPILINFTSVQLVVRWMQLLLLNCLHWRLPHQLHQIALFVVVLRWHAIHIDQLVFAGHPFHAALSRWIKELFTVRARHVRSVVDEHFLAKTIEVDPLSIGGKAVSLIQIDAVEVADLVVWRQWLQLRVTEANVLIILWCQHFCFDVFWLIGQIFAPSQLILLIYWLYLNSYN